METEELAGPEEAVGRRAGDSQVPLLAASIPFPCCLCEACRKGNCWAVHTAMGKGEQLRGETAGYDVSSPHGLDEGQETCWLPGRRLKGSNPFFPTEQLPG